MQPTPAITIVGFLGSGKTTLMSHLLAQAIARGLRIGLVVNDFDEFSVDAHLLSSQAGGQNVLELPGGCMCCQLGDSLADALNTLLALREFDWFFIETSGLAEPLEVVHQLTTPALLPSIEPRLMVAVIDIEAPVPEQDGARLLWEQARASQVVLLNKADQIAWPALERAEQRVREYNPQAEVVITQQARIDLDRLLTAASMVEQRPQVPTGRRDLPHLHASYNSWAVELPRNLDRTRFESLLRELPASVVRAKGFVHFNGEAGMDFFNRVGDFVQIAPLEGAGRPPAMIVCIGRRLDAEQLDALVRQALA